jgi:hypothetical protein
MTLMPPPIPDIEPWFSDGLEVRNSSIHGRGLFVSRYLTGGSDILRLGGFLFHISERRSGSVMPSTTTPLSENVLLAEPSGGSKDYSDYINHSCDPNIGFRDAISLVAIRDIPTDEELVIDYAFWECDPDWKLRQTCNCGRGNCRKNITGKDWMLVRPTDHLFRYFSPFVKRRILNIAIKGSADDE